MKLILRLLLLLIVLLIVAFGLIAYYVDDAAKAGIETAMTKQLGVETTLEDISISFMSANCEINSLAVANPPGYSADPIFKLGRGAVELNAQSLRDDVVEIPKIEIEGIRLLLEQKGSDGNYDAILDKLKQAGGDEAPAEEEGAGPRFLVKEIIIKDTQVKAIIQPFGDALPTPPVDITIPEIRLENVGSEDENGISLAELGSQIFSTVFVKIGDEYSGNLPTLIADGLVAGLKGLPQLETIAGNIEGGVGGALEGVIGAGGAGLEGVGEGLKGVGEGVGEAGEKIKKGLGGLLGGDDK